ncbi:MAG TPA: DUF3662 and FHA domain-containing protein [Mycobacteriales bacterium]|nr:hypothetical protein [Cryptosporangiaceae bacterium]MDQ1678106.1 hypothetical protein [Actinomycetota bacterium]HEV7755641.1 DUF3662 and FHA domain-containing protein [Mycobacteriales bacterium]
MGVLQRFEKRLENLVEGAFAKVFKGVVHPVEIASAMQREADAHKSILGAGRTLVPNRYIIDLSPSDHDRLESFAAPLAQELAQAQAEYIGEQGWTVYGDVIVEIERGEGLDTGMFRVVSEVYTGTMDSPQAPSYGDDPYGDGGYGYGAPPVPSPPTMAPPVSGSPLGGGTPRLVGSDGRQYSIAMGSTVLGRGEAAQVRIADVGISRQHARVDFDGTRVVITDLGSTNGTAVNGSRINAAALQSGDTVQIGTTTLTFRLDG